MSVSSDDDSDDLGDEGCITELRANKNLKSIQKRDLDGFVFEVNGISTEKKPNPALISTGKKMPSNNKYDLMTPNKMASGRKSG